MGRQPRNGIDYFPVSSNPEGDVHLEYLIACYGNRGYGVYTRLLSRIYAHSGYFTEWNTRTLPLFAQKINEEQEFVKQLVFTCTEEGLFDKLIYEKYRVLTSDEILRTYLNVCAKRTAETQIITEYCNPAVLDKFADRCSNLVFVDVNGFPGTDTPLFRGENHLCIRKGNESKLKESKVNTAFLIEGDINYEAVIEAWNVNIQEINQFNEKRGLGKCKIPAVQLISDTRRRYIKTRLSEKPFEYLNILYAIKDSEFLQGVIKNKNPKHSNWAVTFDWIFSSANNYIKVLEGHYKNERKSNSINEAGRVEQNLRGAQQFIQDLSNQ